MTEQLMRLAYSLWELADVVESDEQSREIFALAMAYRDIAKRI